jgi:hypothetical protein
MTAQMPDRRRSRIPGLVDARLLQAFAPRLISGLKLWLDFGDLTTLYQSAAPGNPVTADAQTIGLALDKSGNENHAYQGTTAARPLWKASQLNGYGGAQFDASDDLLMLVAAISANPATVGLVWKNANAAGTYGAISGDLYISGPTYDYYLGRTSDAGLTFTQAESAATFRAQTLYLSGTPANRKMYINASSITPSVNTSTSAFANLTGICDASGQPKLNGVICELCVWDNLLSDDDRGRWHNYISGKYNLGF